MDECYACVVGVATGPESHAEDCPARNIPMPVQDGQWGPEWDEYDRRVAEAKDSSVTTKLDLRFGDCLDVLRELPDASIDAVVCDPPYGLADHKPERIAQAVTAWTSGDREHVPDGKGFMGRSWDAFVPPPAVWDECLRVLKPGGHLLAFAGSRTADLMGLSVRLAGFEIRDTIMWVYGSGFPKSLDVSKAIDKHGQGKMRRAKLLHFVADRAVDAQWLIERGVADAKSFTDWTVEDHAPSDRNWVLIRDALGVTAAEEAAFEREVIGQGRSGAAVVAFARDKAGSYDITAPATPAAEQWQGWGTALKPAQEPIIVARKPLSGTVAANVLEHGTGGINVDACRVGASGGGTSCSNRDETGRCRGHRNAGRSTSGETFHGPETSGGRWPANVLLSHSELCHEPGSCAPGCPVAELDRQSGITKDGVAVKRNRSGEQNAHGIYGSHVRGAAEDQTYGGEGGASRFFPTFRYQAKAPSKERPKIDGKGWPTVKPLALMRWLVRLVTPPGGVVLDPFAGSGTTLQAARDEGFASIGVEKDEFAYRLACQRLGLPEVVPMPVADVEPDPVMAAIRRANSDEELIEVYLAHESLELIRERYGDAIRQLGEQ